MEYQLENKADVIPLVKRVFWLAWQACAGTLGSGFLQDQPGATENQVWDNVMNQGDYHGPPDSEPCEPYGDYVFGRMMKLGVRFNEKKKTVMVSEGKPDIEYQAWSGRYPSYKSLLEASILALELIPA